LPSVIHVPPQTATAATLDTGSAAPYAIGEPAR
jgi:hypothetical protein